MSTKNKKGVILKGVGGFYNIRDTVGNICICKACGRFRKEGVAPILGDKVLFSYNDNANGYIEKIYPRKNELTRPRAANIDIAAIVISAEKPKADCLLLDKQIIKAQLSGIKPLLIINKCDAAEQCVIDELSGQYEKVCGVLRVSALTGRGIDELKTKLKGYCTCFAGQSAVGKTSILNALFPSLNLETGGLSKKIDRGRHTTRHAQMLFMDDICVIDTPGFSLLESAALEPEQLSSQYKDMLQYAKKCRFASCLHADEPDCGVKEAVERGDINEKRYNRYIKILNELKDRRSKKYD
ncbi:MAG: ribosome small subunit-dependent GTPase A [Christensenellales bacterium]